MTAATKVTEEHARRAHALHGADWRVQHILDHIKAERGPWAHRHDDEELWTAGVVVLGDDVGPASPPSAEDLAWFEREISERYEGGASDA